MCKSIYILLTFQVGRMETSEDIRKKAAMALALSRMKMITLRDKLRQDSERHIPNSSMWQPDTG